MNDRYIAGSDLHICKERPLYRTDDYLATCLFKLGFYVETANTLKARLLIPGDIVDSVFVSTGVINSIIAVLRKAKQVPLVVAGQHDQYYHSQDLKKTPIYNLHLAGAVILLQDETVGDVTGIGFEGSKIPDDHGEILITHKCVTPKKPPPFLEEAVSAKDMLKQCKQFKLVITGDYHHGFTHTSTDGTLLVNPGTMMRNKKDIREYQPAIYLITKTDGVYTAKLIKVPVKPAAEVFDLGRIEYDEKHGVLIDTTKLKNFMEDDTDMAQVKFEDVVVAVAKECDIILNEELMKEVFDDAKHES